MVSTDCHASITKLTLEEFSAYWGPTFADADYCWRIVEADGNAAGFGLLYILKPRVPPLAGFVQWTYIDPSCRRKGAGQELVENLFAWARDRHVQRVELQYIDGNQFAERFWRKMGFEPYARKCVNRRSFTSGGTP